MGDNAYWRNYYAGEATRLQRDLDTVKVEVERLRAALEGIARPGCRTAFSSDFGEGITTCLDLLRVIREQGSGFGRPRILPVAFTLEKNACPPCRASAALEESPK